MTIQELADSIYFDKDDAPTIDVYCPGCGAKDDYPQSDWDCSIKPDQISDGMNGVATRHILDITCQFCNKPFTPREWHRARERHVFASLGFVTPNAMKEARVSA